MGIPWVFRCVPAVPLSEPDVAFPFSNVNVDCGVVPSDSECEFVEPQTLSLSRKREASFVQSRKDINFDGALVKALPTSRRKLVPPTPQQNPQPPVESMPRQREEEDQKYCSCGTEHGRGHWWTARDRAVTARMVQHLNKSESLGAGGLPAGARGVRCRHQAHCPERKRRKASKALPRIQCEGTERFLCSQRDAMG